jgi:hypothetical protein
VYNTTGGKKKKEKKKKKTDRHHHLSYCVKRPPRVHTAEDGRRVAFNALQIAGCNHCRHADSIHTHRERGGFNARGGGTQLVRIAVIAVIAVSAE